MIKIGNCIFQNENKLEFKYGEREFIIKEIDSEKKSFLLNGFTNNIPISVFMDCKEFKKFLEDFHPDCCI